MARNAGGKPQFAIALDARRPKSPEMRLACAVIVDAWDLARLDLERPAPSSMRYGAPTRKVVDEARAFFLSDDREWPYSFLNLCDAVGLDPEAVRGELDVAPRLERGVPLEARRVMEGRRD